MGQVWIGTSGWTYDGWRGPFYPPDVPKRRWLDVYCYFDNDQKIAAPKDAKRLMKLLSGKRA